MGRVFEIEEKAEAYGRSIRKGKIIVTTQQNRSSIQFLISMKFLTKRSDSEIIKQNLVYTNNTIKNRELQQLLLHEQKNFCAYSEKYVQELESVCVEHFNAALKGTVSDNYYNYYAVLHKINIQKLDEKYRNASFMTSLFFQTPNGFASMIRYIDGVYEEINPADEEAKELIDFLALNSPELHKQRIKHVNRLRDNFKLAGFDSKEQKLEYLRKDNDQLSFITALEIELGLDLSEFYS